MLSQLRNSPDPTITEPIPHSLIPLFRITSCKPLFRILQIWSWVIKHSNLSRMILPNLKNSPADEPLALNALQHSFSAFLRSNPTIMLLVDEFELVWVFGPERCADDSWSNTVDTDASRVEVSQAPNEPSDTKLGGTVERGSEDRDLASNGRNVDYTLRIG